MTFYEFIKLQMGSRRRPVVGAEKVFFRVEMKKLGHPGAGVPLFLGVTTSLANRYANGEIPLFGMGEN